MKATHSPPQSPFDSKNKCYILQHILHININQEGQHHAGAGSPQFYFHYDTRSERNAALDSQSFGIHPHRSGCCAGHFGLRSYDLKLLLLTINFFSMLSTKKFKRSNIKDAKAKYKIELTLALLYLSLAEVSFNRTIADITSMTQHVGEKFLLGIYENFVRNDQLFEAPNFYRRIHKNLFLRVMADMLASIRQGKGIGSNLISLKFERGSSEEDAVMRFLYNRFATILADAEQQAGLAAKSA